MKQCPKCNFSCQDDDVICKNCGYLFLPKEFKVQEEIKASNQPLENHSPDENNAENDTGAGKMALASMVLGVIGAFFTCCYGVGSVFGIIALTFGMISYKNLKKSNGTQKSRNMSAAGIVLGIIAIVLGVLFVSIIIANRESFAQVMQKYMQTIQKNNAL